MFFLSGLVSCNNNGPSDYDVELATIESKLVEPDKKPVTGAAHKKAATQRIYYLYLKASLTGDFGDFKTAEDAILASLKTDGDTEQLLLFTADLNFKLHRASVTQTALDKLSRFSQHPRIKALAADIALQNGQYKIALTQYNRLLEENRDWGNLARLAYYKGKTGAPGIADQLYAEAQDMLSSKEMRHYAWLELQRGVLDFELKHYPDALAHYKKADMAYSGYWLIQEHIAEVYARMGQTREAIDLYRKVVKKTPHPDLISALANITDDPAEKTALYKQAETVFTKNQILYEEASRGHLIEHLLVKQETDPHLLQYALQNHQLRPNAEAKLLLAKVLYKTNDIPAAKLLMQEILKTPWKSLQIDLLAQQLGMQDALPAKL